MSEDDCNVSFGTYLGDGTRCDSSSCSPWPQTSVQSLCVHNQRPMFDLNGGNGTFLTADKIAINATTKTALVTGLDITTTADADFYKLTVPAGSSNLLRVRVRSAGLSLLSPKVYLYDSLFVLRGFDNGAGEYGTTLAINFSGIDPGETYYVKVVGANSSVFGTGAYALTLNTGSAPNPASGSSPTTRSSIIPAQTTSAPLQRPVRFCSF